MTDNIPDGKQGFAEQQIPGNQAYEDQLMEQLTESFERMNSTNDSDHRIQEKDIVTVRGYAGWAKVMGLVQDGEAFGKPKFVANVLFHPNDKDTKHKKTYQFPVGRLTRVGDEPVKSGSTKSPKRANQLSDEQIANMDKAELLARLAEINARLGTPE